MFKESSRNSVLAWDEWNGERLYFVLQHLLLLPEQSPKQLQPHEIPYQPWAKVGVDMFELGSTKYVITVDYYLNFFEVDSVKYVISSTVIRKMKVAFARHGISDIVVSDNGLQFSSQEF